MNILQVSKFFYIRGGAVRYFFEISKLLNKYNHRVGFFSMHDIRNKKTSWSKYFVSNISTEDFKLINLFKYIDRLFYSFEVNRKLSLLLEDFKPDIAHIHYSIYHQLSPSILLQLKKQNIPVVMTVHDYHLIGLNYNLFHNGAICEVTRPNKFYKAIFHKCVKDSYLHSFIEVVEKYFNYLIGWERNYVDYFIAPSLFMKKKLIEYGYDENKIICLPYFIDYAEYIPRYGDGNYVLYFGRLSAEKGLAFLLNAIKKLPYIRFKIAGIGNEENNLKLKVKREKIDNVDFLGYQDGYQLKKIIQNSKFTVLPSIWYDVAPISILESFAGGKPMIASNIGGILEIVKSGFNGFLCEPGNLQDYMDKINKLWNDPVLCRNLGRNARNYVEKYFTPEEHYEKLMKIYRMTIYKR